MDGPTNGAGGDAESDGARELRQIAAVLADPLRCQVLLALERSPATVRQLAHELHVSEGRVRYQAQYLVNHGLAVSNGPREQRTYHAVQPGWQELIDLARRLARSPRPAARLQ